MLEVVHLNVSTKSRKSDYILKNISFKLVAGNRIGLIGPSGAGKSLLAATIMVLNEENLLVEGQIIYNGVDLLTCSSAHLDTLRGKDLAIIFQNPEATFNPVRTIGSQLHEAITIHQDLSYPERVSLINNFLQRLQLHDVKDIFKLYPHQLSGGQLQRLTVIMSIINQPKLIIADEITSSLDEENTEIIVSFLDEYSDKYQCGLIFISHDQKQVYRLTDRFIYIENGTIKYNIRKEDTQTTPIINQYFEWSFGEKVIHNHSENTPLIEMQNGAKSYKVGKFFNKHHVDVFKGVSFLVHLGEIVGIYGASGSGKSTLAKVLSGVTSLDKGTIFISGSRITQIHKINPRDVQIVFQDSFFTFNPKYTIGTLLQEVYHVYRDLYPNEDFMQVLTPLIDKFNLSPELLNSYSQTLSGGQRQRFAIIQCLLVKPKCLILDESLSALDRKNQIQILEALTYLRNETDLTTIIISHDLDLVRFAADRIYTFLNGNIGLQLL